MKLIIGIDFGTQLAGRTAVACLRNNEILIEQNRRGRSTDSYLQNYFREIREKPGLIVVDVPLSLPEVYSFPNFRNYSKGDFHFRECDRLLGAMSPMFVGGLTARAMEFAARKRDNGWMVYETYPKAVAQELGVYNASYKRTKNKEEIIEMGKEIAGKYNLTLVNLPENRHQLDALLSLIAGYRIAMNEAKKIGDPDEGIIYT